MRQLALAFVGVWSFVAAQAAASFYKSEPIFSSYPDENGPRYVIERLGPVGIGLDLIQPAFTMLISNVETGSPAAATGKLKKGQIIESINGQTLKDIDPRVQLGNLITEVEATDGVLRLRVKDSPTGKAEEVVVQIPVLGAYSETWPLNCPKSDKIVRNFADFLARTDKGGYGAALFLLSTGEEQDLAVVRRWFHKLPETGINKIPWDVGYLGPAVCEYYLRTGDATVLPAIKSAADYLARTIYNGSWATRGEVPFRYMAGGHMNAAGVHCLTFLLLAKECGVEVHEETLQSALKHFFRYAGRGNVSYGDGLPEGGFVDNGKTGGLAFSMAAAASLTPEGEASVYAKARDISATKSFYSTSWLYHGHTGGGIGEIWRGAAMGLMKDKRPVQYRSFMNERRWMYELSRCHDGAFGIVGGFWNANGRYNVTGHNGGRAWGNMFPLVYTIPRQHLRMFGAPPTKFSKTYQLPKRPWGTAADDVFYSLEAGGGLDISRELVATDASKPLGARLGRADVSDETLRLYARHIDQGIRASTASAIVRKGRDELVVELLKDSDPRARHTGVLVIAGQFKGQALPAARVTDEMVALLAGMINDPAESWWVAHDAMLGLSRARLELIVPHVDRLVEWLQHEDWWLRRAALIALTPVATDARYYEKILPIVGEMLAKNERAVAMHPVDGIVERLKDAAPAMQAFAVKVLGQAYTKFPTKLTAPGGQNMQPAVDVLLEGLATDLVALPGGFDELYRVSQQRFPNATLQHKALYLAGDPARFGPELSQAIVPLIREEWIPEYIVTKRGALDRELNARQPSATVAGLVGLYQKAGIPDYNWRLWGPARDKIKWQYYSYDPKETKIWEKGWRYRPVSWPVGAENWFTAEFDPVKAGWKTGLAPFANVNGKLEPLGRCVGNFCGCGEPPHTFWEKEVLLMRSLIAAPAMRDDHAYRLLVGGRSHVFGGDGTDVWLDGKYKDSGKNRPSIPGVDKREGGQPRGFNIADDFRPAFADGQVLVAATGFLRLHGGARTPSNYQSFWFEEMKLPVVTPEQIVKGATLIGLTSAEWQALQDPDVPDRDLEAGKFRYDGRFVANPAILGNWQAVQQVAAIEDFDPGKKVSSPKPRIAQITFQDGGLTDSRWRIWSGDTLLDMDSGQALKMTAKAIGEAEYLFIEAGGFGADKGADWKSPWIVLRRLEK